MSTVPRKLPEAIVWTTNRVPVWAQAGAAIGLDPVKVGQLGAKASAAQAALTEYQEAEAIWLAKGQVYRELATSMRDDAAAMVFQIRGTAKASANPGAVYAAAQIPAPAQPGPTPPPGTPTEFAIVLLQNGDLTIGFKCNNPGNVAGVQYHVERSVAGTQGPYAFLQTVGERRFTDTTIPQGSSAVHYRVTARRSTQPGNPAVFSVQFGSGNNAVQTAKIVVDESSPSQAA